MKELNYISDKELEQLILQVEQEELVAAPPDMMENILAKLEESVMPETKELSGQNVQVQTVSSLQNHANRQKEFTAYCFRVITSVAAAIALVFLLPELSARISQTVPSQTTQTPEFIRQEVPQQQEVVDAVPSREEVVAVKQTPSKEEVLNDTGLVEQILNYTEQFYKKENKQ